MSIERHCSATRITKDIGDLRTVADKRRNVGFGGFSDSDGEIVEASMTVETATNKLETLHL